MKLNEVDVEILALLDECKDKPFPIDRKTKGFLRHMCMSKFKDLNRSAFDYRIKKLRDEGYILLSNKQRGIYKITEKGVEERRSKIPEEPIKEFKEEKWTHTGGVKKLGNGLVAKPLIGRHRTSSAINTKTGKFVYKNHEYPTQEYEALKDLNGLPHIPKNVEKQIIDGIPHLIREDLLVLEDEDYKTLRESDLIEIEKTIRKAHERGWTICDNIQIGYSEKQNEYVIYDWSNAHKLGEDSDHFIVRDEMALERLWEESGFSRYAKARSWANSERFKQKWNTQVKQAEKGIPPRDRKIPQLNYTYMSFSRPPHWLGIEYPEGDLIIQDITQKEQWQPLGLIHTEKPLTEEQMYQAELTPTKYEELVV